MPTSKYVTNARDFVKSLEAHELKYHLDIMDTLAISLNNIRYRAALKYMYPSKYSVDVVKQVGINKHGGATMMAFHRGASGRLIPLTRLQPPKADKLTRRTGILFGVLVSPGTWQKSKTQYRLRADPRLMFWIRPQKEGNTSHYSGRMTITGRPGDDLEYRLMHESRGARGTGIKRPFLAPAIQDEFPQITRNLNKVVNILRVA